MKADLKSASGGTATRQPPIPLSLLIEAHAALVEAASAPAESSDEQMKRRLRAANAYGALGYYVKQYTAQTVPVRVESA